jgi:hypothetical protein
MKAAVLEAVPGDLVIEDITIDAPGPREVTDHSGWRREPGVDLVRSRIDLWPDGDFGCSPISLSQRAKGRRRIFETTGEIDVENPDDVLERARSPADEAGHKPGESVTVIRTSQEL